MKSEALFPEARTHAHKNSRSHLGVSINEQHSGLPIASTHLPEPQSGSKPAFRPVGSNFITIGAQRSLSR